MADERARGRSNIVALGVLARLLALPLAPLVAVAGRALKQKGLRSGAFAASAGRRSWRHCRAGRFRSGCHG
ncbi:MAG: hypothetical protein MZU84_05520 [Sphingobacterium sp.]|nr:hypothetical protein [Sphingobacterium sp.]